MTVYVNLRLHGLGCKVSSWCSFHSEQSASFRWMSPCFVPAWLACTQFLCVGNAGCNTALSNRVYSWSFVRVVSIDLTNEGYWLRRFYHRQWMPQVSDWLCEPMYHVSNYPHYEGCCVKTPCQHSLRLKDASSALKHSILSKDFLIIALASEDNWLCVKCFNSWYLGPRPLRTSRRSVCEGE